MSSRRRATTGARPQRSSRAAHAGPNALPATRRALEDRSLEAKQRFLALQAARVSDQLPVCTDHAVAWQHDRKRIAIHDGADSPSGTRAGGARRQLTVRDNLAVGDACEFA